MLTAKNSPMFHVDDAKLKQSVINFFENGCILCRHKFTCQLPQHNNFRFGDPMCPNAELVHPVEAFVAIFGPAITPVSKQHSGQKEKGK